MESTCILWKLLLTLTLHCSSTHLSTCPNCPLSSSLQLTCLCCVENGVVCLDGCGTIMDTNCSVIVPLALNDSGVSRGRELYRIPGGSSESVNGTEELYARRRGVELGGAAHSTLANHTSTSGLTPNSSSRPGRRPKGTVGPNAHLLTSCHLQC